MKNKRKYKFNSGIQQIAMDTPDYSKAYELQAEEGAKNQGIKNAAAQFSGAYAPIGQIGGMAGDVIKSRNKSKGGAQLGGAVSMGSSGAAFGAKMGSFAGPIGTGVGAGVGLLAGGIYGAVTGGKEYTKGKRLQAEADRQAEWDNYNKGFNINGSATDAQARVAKKGKYKLKTGTSTFKQPRMIETEGREPIFSPKKADGTRDLLYYNPDDPTHAEGGVKAMVMPKAQAGKQKVKAKTKPVEEPYTPLEDNDSVLEEVGELFDPTGISSWDDVYRSTRNLINNKDRDIGDYVGTGLDILGAVPVLGKAGKLVKMGKTAFKYLDKGADASKIIKRAKQIQKVSKAPTGNILTRTVKKGTRVGDKIADWAAIPELAKDNTSEILNTNFSKKDPNILNKDYSVFKNPDWNRTHTLENATFLGRKIFPTLSGDKMYNNGTNNLMPKRPASKYSLVGNGNMAVGARQLKVNNLNDTALSNNLIGMPAANVANKFIQPTAGISQVARNIPEVRRKATIKNPMSHRKENPDTNRIINPPTTYDMMPKPEKSHSKKVKVYR
jgi:hypothetical protein